MKKFFRSPAFARTCPRFPARRTRPPGPTGPGTERFGDPEGVGD